jgi:hypothetical protein
MVMMSKSLVFLYVPAPNIWESMMTPKSSQNFRRLSLTSTSLVGFADGRNETLLLVCVF